MAIVNHFSVRAFYYTVESEKDYGYVKVAVSSKLRVDGQKRRTIPHGYYPVFFMPFMRYNGRHFLASENAFMARDIATIYHNPELKKWQLYTFRVPAHEQARFSLITEKITHSLERIISSAEPLTQKKESQRRRFLGQFPHQLREGLDHSVLYGTTNNKQCEFTINEDELDKPLKDTSRLPKPRIQIRPGAWPET